MMEQGSLADLLMQDLATGIREQATANQFQNQQEFCDIKTRMAANHCETLAAIQTNQAAIIGYMTQEKISGLERENAALTMQLSQNAQTRAIIEALSRTSTTTPAAQQLKHSLIVWGSYGSPFLIRTKHVWCSFD